MTPEERLTAAALILRDAIEDLDAQRAHAAKEVEAPGSEDLHDG